MNVSINLLLLYYPIKAERKSAHKSKSFFNIK
jgi:hypothetical protein